jgi:hypothetical protein
MIPYPSWLPGSRYSLWAARPVDFLRALCVGEAENQPFLGQLGVCYTILTRQRYAEWQFFRWWDGRTVQTIGLAQAQFSCFWGDGWTVRKKAILAALGDPGAYPSAHRAATAAIEGSEPDPTCGPGGYGADHYKVIGVPAAWARYMLRTVTIGRHEWFCSLEVP